MIVDLHSHTRYSNCGADEPEELVCKMIESGVDVFGITDHHHGICQRKKEYFNLLTELKEKYKDKITLYRGIEIATVDFLEFDRSEDISYFDYCLIEHIDHHASVTKGGLIEYINSLNLKAGIAHTDLFYYVYVNKLDPYEFFYNLKKNGIFWEMNVSYDSIHSFNEHKYVKELFTNKEYQSLIRDVGLEISVGFDGHRKEEYKVERVSDACKFLLDNGFNLITEF